jgi:hypothetical protein
VSSGHVALRACGLGKIEVILFFPLGSFGDAIQLRLFSFLA